MATIPGGLKKRNMRHKAQIYKKGLQNTTNFFKKSWVEAI